MQSRYNNPWLIVPQKYIMKVLLQTFLTKKNIFVDFSFISHYVIRIIDSKKKDIKRHYLR